VNRAVIIGLSILLAVCLVAWFTIMSNRAQETSGSGGVSVRTEGGVPDEVAAGSQSAPEPVQDGQSEPEAGSSSLAQGQGDSEAPDAFAGAGALPVHGHVLAETGTPVAGAEILLVIPSPNPVVVWSASAAADGSFRLETPTTGDRWALLADAPGFVRGGRADLSPGDLEDSLEIVLRTEATIQGRVIENLTGSPIPDATVALIPNEDVPALDRLWQHLRPLAAKPGPGGGYALGDLLPGKEYDLVGGSPTHVPRERLDVPSGSTGIDFVLSRGGSVGGVVLADTTGKGLAGARITAWTDEGDGFRREVLSEQDGRFLVQGLPFAAYRVRAEWEDLSSHPRPGQGSEAILTVSEPDRRVTLIVKAWPVGVLAGTVRDLEGYGVAQAVVEVFEVPGRTRRFHAETDTWGRYRIEGIFGGDYRVVPRAGGLFAEERGLRFIDGEVREDFDFVMIPGFMIAGRVTLAEEETGVPGASIGAEGRRWNDLPRAESSEDGHYEFGPVPTGDYVLEARPPEGYVGKEDMQQVSVSDTDVDGVDFTMEQGGMISGTVVSATGPLEGAIVSLATARETDEQIETYRGTTRTDITGYYELKGIPKGLVYSVVAEQDGYTRYLSQIDTMRDSEPVEHPTIKLETPGGTILGIARTTNGYPAPAFGASAQRQDVQDLYRSSGRWRGSALTRRAGVTNGEFMLGGLEAGVWEVSLFVPRSLRVDPKQVNVPANGEVAVEFIVGGSDEDSATISGRVVLANGDPATGYRVRAFAGRRGGFSMASTDGTGTFVLAGLTEGREYRLEAQEPGGSFWSGGNGPSTSVTASAEGVVLVYENPGILTGQVLDSNGVAVANYQIQVRSEGRRGGFRGGGGSLGSVETMRGVYVVRDLLPGRYRVEGYAPELAPAESEWVDVEAGRVTEGVDLVFDTGATLRGIVLEEGTQDPVPGARVFTRSGTWSRSVSDDLVERSTYTDSEGRFALDHLPAGRAWLVASHGEYATEFERDLEIPAEGDPDEITIYLAPGGVVEGVVVDSAGNGIPAQEVNIRRRRFQSYTAVTDGAGNFRRGQLEPGEYRVEWRSYRENVQVENRQTSSVIIRESTEAAQ
jgi:hypothetical protein